MFPNVLEEKQGVEEHRWRNSPNPLSLDSEVYLLPIHHYGERSRNK